MADKTEKKPGFVARMKAAVKGFAANVAKFFRDTKSELKKVVWPTKSQMINNTVIVLVCVLIVGICIWLFDAVGGIVVNGIITLFKG